MFVFELWPILMHSFSDSKLSATWPSQCCLPKFCMMRSRITCFWFVWSWVHVWLHSDSSNFMPIRRSNMSCSLSFVRQPKWVVLFRLSLHIFPSCCRLCWIVIYILYFQQFPHLLESTSKFSNEQLCQALITKNQISPNSVFFSKHKLGTTAFLVIDLFPSATQLYHVHDLFSNFAVGLLRWFSYVDWLHAWFG